MSKKNILFIINGFGMGNATRCESLIEVLNPKYNVDILTSDRAYAYFNETSFNGDLFAQHDLNLKVELKYGSLTYYFQYIPHFLKRVWKNYSIQKNVLHAKDYSHVFFDSDYSLSLHRCTFQKSRPKYIAVNNAFEVLHFVFHRPQKIKFKLVGSLLVELADFFFFNLLSDAVVCPSLNFEDLSRNRNFRNLKVIPALVRSSLFKVSARQSEPRVLITSTSSKVHSVLKDLEKSKSFNLKNQSELRHAEIVVCNAGQSTLAECLYLNKKTLVIPISKHAEQFVNSQIAASAGLSVLTDDTASYFIENEIQNILDKSDSHSNTLPNSFDYQKNCQRVQEIFDLELGL